MTNSLGGVFAEWKSAQSKWPLLVTLDCICSEKRLLAILYKNFDIDKNLIGMLVQNMGAVGQESSSGDPLIFENVTKMSKSSLMSNPRVPNTSKNGQVINDGDCPTNVKLKPCYYLFSRNIYIALPKTSLTI